MFDCVALPETDRIGKGSRATKPWLYLCAPCITVVIWGVRAHLYSIAKRFHKKT